MRLHIRSMRSNGTGPGNIALTDGEGRDLSGLQVTRLVVDWSGDGPVRCELEAIEPRLDVWCEGEVTRIRTRDGRIYQVQKEEEPGAGV